MTKSPHFSPLFPPIFDTTPHAGGTQRPEDKEQLAARWPERQQPNGGKVMTKHRVMTNTNTDPKEDIGNQRDGSVSAGDAGDLRDRGRPKGGTKTQEIGSEIND